ncbi:MAG TPA: ABC transporter permease [Acidobacteriaceae bacterium]|jgi:putative ABC transport system permease protein|nr:ABC transporter permease [Acidobacteriaceae bacterium]
MRALKRFFARIRNFAIGRRGDDRLREEIEQHLAMQTGENIRAGMSPEEARRQARLKLGGVETIREQFHAEEGLPFLETLLQDLRFAFRVLRKSPGFAITVIITLALGIGANTAVFSIVYGVVFRPLPYPHPQRIVELTESSPRGTDEEDVTYQELQFLQEHSSPFQFLAGSTVNGYNLSVGNKTERVKGQPVSTDYFRVLGIRPLLGRDFLAEENIGNGAHVAILSYGIWQRQMGGDRETIGRTITLDGEPFTVIGVMPPGLEASVDPIMPGDTDVWTPLALVGQTAGSGQNIEVLGRLRRGLSLEQAQAQMRSITTEFRKPFPHELGPTTTLSIQSYQTMLSSDVRMILLVLFGAVGFVLLIACANVANLLLGRATARSRQFAVRAAIGASRMRLVRQLLTESVLLSIIAALLALLFARIGMRSLVALSPSDLPRANDIHLDGWAFAFTLSVAVITGILFGLVPAFRASFGKIYEKLGEATARMSSGRKHGRLRAALVISEVAMCVILLTGAALLIETFWHVLNTDPGFNPTHVLSIEVYLSGSRYNSTATVSHYYDQTLQRIEPLPGVQSASAITAGLPLRRGANFGLSVAGKQVPHTFGIRMVMPDYVRTMGVPLVLGRSLTAGDNEKSSSVAVISYEAARLLFPGQNPIGQHFQFARLDWQVVGMVGDVRSYLDKPAEASVYIPLAQTPYPVLNLVSIWFPEYIVVRTSADPLALSRSIEQRLQAIDPSIAIGHIRTMEQVRSGAVAMRQFNMTLLSVFAGLALLLAAIGIYGVIAYSVTQRTHEIGVRMALGAKRRDVLRLVLNQVMVLAGLGIAFGIAGALALTRLLEGYLYRVKPTDPFTLAAACAVLAIAAILASYLPARRAASVDPMQALRCE